MKKDIPKRETPFFFNFVGAHVLRETFDKKRPTGSLDTVLSTPPVHAILQTLRTKRVLNPTQWGKPYPAIRSSVSAANFDITLLMVLLRNICGLVPPPTGWNSLPAATDARPQLMTQHSVNTGKTSRMHW